ncbi:MAG: hypothetical protein LBB84_12260 [Tannerellaceae bacterium]|nr:hypothetical protein [Tannerellaceae bacterium]
MNKEITICGWVTALSIKALDEDVPDRNFLFQAVKNHAFRHRHPFNTTRM